MKKILAIIAATLLVAMYIVTLVSSIINSPFSKSLFNASLAMTILLPILIYAIIWLRKVLKLYFPTHTDEDGDETKTDPE